MPNRTDKIGHLRQKVAASAKHRSPHLLGNELSESGLLDHAVLNRQIHEILDELPEEAALALRMEQSLEDFLGAIAKDDISATANHVCALLSLELDELRKAALLSLMVRLAGKRKFDPIAHYILQNQQVFATSRG